MSRFLAVAALMAAACFDPSFKQNIECASGGACPPGLACVDGVCRSGGAIDAPVEDAAAIDATVDAAPVACDADDDCKTPPSPCLTAGTCDLGSGTCAFGTVDCSGMTGACTVGVCDQSTGACVAQATNEGGGCGSDSCGPFSPCDGFDATCDASGTQSRSCTRSTCQSGSCVAATSTETAACTRVTEDVVCGADTVGGCDTCGAFSDVCDEGGSQTCTCTAFRCRSEVCTPVATSCQQACARDTDGTSCGATTESCPTNCAYESVCDQDAPARSCTCTSFSCSGGACAGVPSSCTVPCSRNQQGVRCGCQVCSAGEGGRPRACNNGTCSLEAGAGCGDC
jgi:hypothetical protein